MLVLMLKKYDHFGFGFELTVCEVLFTLPTYNNPDMLLLNFPILLGKWYINNCKFKKQQSYF